MILKEVCVKQARCRHPDRRDKAGPATLHDNELR